MCFVLLPVINSTVTEFCVIEFNNGYSSDVDFLESDQESVCLPSFPMTPRNGWMMLATHCPSCFKTLVSSLTLKIHPVSVQSYLTTAS